MTKLKNLRKVRNLTLRQVAELVGVTPQTVHRMEHLGIHKPITAQQYTVAFPDLNWTDLIDEPAPRARN